MDKIDNIIDNDVKNDIKSFNPDENDEVRRRLMDSREIFIPVREHRFENMIDDLYIIHKARTQLKSIKNIENSFSSIEEEEK